jgi:hypothetical protein
MHGDGFNGDHRMRQRMNHPNDLMNQFVHCRSASFLHLVYVRIVCADICPQNF